MPYLPVIGLSPQHLRSHPESRAHQRQLPLYILHRQLHHLPGQPEVSHQRLAAPRRHSNEAVLKGAHGARHETPGKEGPGHFTEQHLAGPQPHLAVTGSPLARDPHPGSTHGVRGADEGWTDHISSQEKSSEEAVQRT